MQSNSNLMQPYKPLSMISSEQDATTGLLQLNTPRIVKVQAVGVQRPILQALFSYTTMNNREETLKILSRLLMQKKINKDVTRQPSVHELVDTCVKGYANGRHCDYVKHLLTIQYPEIDGTPVVNRELLIQSAFEQYVKNFDVELYNDLFTHLQNEQ